MPAFLLAASVLLHPWRGYGQVAAPPPEPQPSSAGAVLQLMPESATVAFALPPATALYAQAHMLETRLSNLGVVSASSLLTRTEQWIKPGGIPDAAALAGLLVAQGVDPEAASAVFLDLSPAATRAQAAVDLITSGRTAWATLESSAASRPDCDWLDLDLTHAVVVLACRDTALALSVVEKLAASLFARSPQEEESWEGFAIHTRGRLAVVAHANRLFVSNDVPMLKETLARVAAPIRLPCVKAEPNLFESNRIILLTRMGRLRSFLPELTTLYRGAIDPGQDPEGTSNALRYPEGVFNDASPCITTLDVSNAGIEVTSRLDLAAHPQFAALCGDARPIRLGALLPEACPLFICVHWTEAGKDLFSQRWSPMFGEGDVLQTLFEILQGEMALGVAISTDREPQLFLLAEIGNGDVIREMVGASIVWEDAEGAPSFQVAQMDSGPFLALSEDTLVITSDPDAMMQILTVLHENKPSRILEMRNPPIQADTQVFGMVSAQTDGLEAAVRFVAEVTHGESPEFFLRPLSSTFGAIRELRAARSVADGWQTVRFAAYFR